MDKQKCSVEGCHNRVMSKGNGYYARLCTKHHRQKYGMPPNKETRIKARFPNDKCVLCGWEGTCDRHRIELGKDGGEYVGDNILILCRNCHMKLHWEKENPVFLGKRIKALESRVTLLEAENTLLASNIEASLVTRV